MAPNPYEEPSGVGTALTGPCSSRLGTDPMWVSMKLVLLFRALRIP